MLWGQKPCTLRSHFSHICNGEEPFLVLAVAKEKGEVVCSSNVLAYTIPSLFVELSISSYGFWGISDETTL